MMKEKFKYIVIGLLLPLFTSCFSHDFVEIVRVVEPKTVTFTLDLAGQTVKTKADNEVWDNDGYETSIGSTFENRILTDDLHVLVYDIDGDFVAQVQKVAYREIGSGQYEFWGILQDASVNSNVTFAATAYRFVVLANCGSLAYAGSIPLPGNLTYTGAWNAAATNRSAIPMWGATDVELTLSESQSLGDIALVRSMSKVEVVLSDELSAEGYSLSDASLTKANGTGYSVPAGWNLTSTEKLLHEAAADSETNGFNEYTEGSEETDKSFFGTSESRIIYVPETTNDGGIMIDVTLNNGSSELVFDGNNAIRLAAYSNGQPTEDYFNLVRNHHYRYVITGVVTGSDLSLVCEVQPWTLEEENLDYETFVSVSEELSPDIGTLYEASGVKYVLMSEHTFTTVTENAGETVEGTLTEMTARLAFTILTPAGYTWYASLIADDEGKSFGFVEYDEQGRALLESDGSLKTTAIVSGKVGSKSEITIVSEYEDAEILSNSISNRIQIIVRNDSTGHIYVVEDDVLGGEFHIVHNK